MCICVPNKFPFDSQGAGHGLGGPVPLWLNAQRHRDLSTKMYANYLNLAFHINK